MKFTLTKSILAGLMLPAAKAVPKKTALPILESLLIESDGKSLTVTGSDQDITIRTKADFEAEQKEAKGAICVPAYVLVDLIANLDGKTVVTFETTGESAVACRWEGGECSLPTFPAKDYPDVTFKDEVLMRTGIAPAEFATLLHNSAYAADNTNELKPVLASVLLRSNPEEKTLTAAASDSHVLAVAVVPTADIEDAIAGETLIPRRSAEVMEKFLPTKEETTAVLEATPSCIRVTVGGMNMQCRTTIGKFVDYERVIPKQAPNALTVDSETLCSALKIITTCASALHPGIIITANALVATQLEGEDISRGTRARQEITGSYEGENGFQICVPADRLLEAVNHLDSEQVVIAFTDPKKAVVVRPFGYEGPGDPCSLVMPIMKSNAEPKKDAAKAE